MCLTPSQVATAIKAMIPTNRAIFIWGPPGVAKSAVAMQVATSLGIAFVDLRLSQIDPTDLRGIPYPVTEHGITGIRWSPPMTLPRDLDITQTREIAFAVDTVTISFAQINPVGSNGIHYVRAPKFVVKSLTPGAIAKIISYSQTHVEAGLFAIGEDGQPSETAVTGAIRINVTGEAHAIIGLEEFNSAPHSVQAAAYQLVFDRRLGEYVVPKACYLMAMGNRETDRGIVYKMATPIMNRFVHIEMLAGIAAFEDWQVWALTQRVHPEVVGYLSAFKASLFAFDVGTAARGFPTPRTWEFVSDILTHNEFLPEAVLLGLITGCVGDAEGAKFMAFRKIASTLPRAEMILNGALKKMPGGDKTEVQLAYALTTTLCYELKERADTIKRKHGDKYKTAPERPEWLKQADNFMEFIMANFQPEICVMGARAAISVHKLPFETTKMVQFDRFAKIFKNLIVSVHAWMAGLLGLGLAVSTLVC